MPRYIGAQLYIFSKKYDLERDIDTILDGLFQGGYDAVEGGPKDATRYREKLRQRNLKMCGHHIMTQELRNPGPLVQYMKTLGAADINASGPIRWRERSPQDYEETARLFNQTGKALRDEGLYLHYHNHDFEFTPIAGERTGMDILLEHLDLSVVDLCVDIGWVWFAGLNPVDFLRTNTNATGYIHLRDFKGKTSTELGRGDMPLPEILKQMDKMTSIREIAIEQDPVVDNPAQSMAASLHYLQGLRPAFR